MSTAADEGIRLVVRVTPRGGRDALEGLVRDANGRRVLKARLASAPEQGKANASLVTLLATEFDVSKNAVSIMRGAGARLKQVYIRGDGKRLAARLAAMGETA